MKAPVSKLRAGVTMGAIVVVAVVAGAGWWRRTAASAAIRTRAAAAAHVCITNLMVIDAAKKQWAAEFKKDPNSTPTWDDLRPYMSGYAWQWGSDLPKCPSGGTYTIGRTADLPTCSFPGHGLAFAPFAVHAVDSEDSGLAGATVEVLDNARHRFKSQTDANGSANFGSLWPNRAVAVIVSKDGYLTSSNPIGAINRSGGNVLLQRRAK